MITQSWKSIVFVIVSVVVGCLSLSCCPSAVVQTSPRSELFRKFNDLSGPYLGQQPPGIERKLFAPGIVSDGLFNGMIFFTAGGTEVYFSSGFIKPFYIDIFFHSHIVEGKWTEPIEFMADRLIAFRSVVSPDGQKVLFISSRIEERAEGEANPILIYAMEKTHTGWTKPMPIDFGDAFPHSCGQVSIATSGNLYFQAGYHIDGDEDIYFAKYDNGGYLTPIRLSEAVNGPEHEVHPCIAPDESFLIFDSQRPDGFGDNDLYVCFPDGEGGWTEATNLGERVNTANDERRSSVSFDGKYLFFESATPDPDTRLPEAPLTLESLRSFLVSAENGGKDIYWIDAVVIEELRP